MTKKTTEKDSRIYIRVSQKDKEKIQKVADACGLTMSEYIVQRALGYKPVAVQPKEFYKFYDKLSEFLNQNLPAETEKSALKLFDEIYSYLIDTQKQTQKEIVMEVMLWQQQDTGRSKAV